MKVICIDDRDQDSKWGKCVVAGSGVYYELEGMNCYYHWERFIPISSIDETEFIREYKKELV